VYPNELLGGRRKVGVVVRLVGPDGKVVGTGVSDAGWLAARVYRFDAGPLDAEWMSKRVGQAADLREVLIDEETTAYRVVNGENDGLPGIRVDRWGHFLCITADTPAVAPLLPLLTAALVERFEPRGIYLAYRPDSRDGRNAEQFRPVPGLLHGREAPGAVRVRERGLAFDVYPAEAPDVGLYTDMRDLRAWLEPFWGGTRVLNTFCFTGAFSLSAAYNGASEVTSVDLSSKYLDRARANFGANELSPAPHDFVEADVFKALDRFRRRGETFDRVILDPPSFSHSDTVWSAKRDYPRLVKSAATVLSDGGWLIAASNQGTLSPNAFRKLVGTGLSRAGVGAQLLYSGTQSGDVPALVSFPEGQYLKIAVYRVLHR
jgi:23S rRNA (cytosine1962-C5)-methyltransferase